MKKNKTVIKIAISSVVFAIFATFTLFMLMMTYSCTSDDLAFDIIESPVLAIFEESEAEPEMIKMSATFYELDKSGILDVNIGIDSTEIGGLPINVFINETTLLEELTTGADGEVIFERAKSDLNGVSKLEWVGVYKDTAFRIYSNL